jgi:hypothetical protein
LIARDDAQTGAENMSLTTEAPTTAVFNELAQRTTSTDRKQESIPLIGAYPNELVTISLTKKYAGQATPELRQSIDNTPIKYSSREKHGFAYR